MTLGQNGDPINQANGLGPPSETLAGVVTSVASQSATSDIMDCRSPSVVDMGRRVSPVVWNSWDNGYIEKGCDKCRINALALTVFKCPDQDIEISFRNETQQWFCVHQSLEDSDAELGLPRYPRSQIVGFLPC